MMQSIGFWIVVFCIFIFIRYFALNEEQGLVLKPMYDIPITEWLHFGVIGGLIIGFFYAFVEAIFERYITPKTYLGLTIVLKSITYLILLILSLSFITLLIEESLDIDLPNERGWWQTSKIFWLMASYFLLAAIIFSFMRMAISHFGRGMFFKMLIGTYRKPSEVDKIFMFLDLKSSTSMAEKLGHYKYSQLIQDCFFDLNSIISKYDTEIYQYVGDEVVLTWNYNTGINKNRCVKLFFEFVDRLHEKADYYNQKYGTVPQFKASLHGGKLMIAEVGFVKKEMAYHGDVINTTARIQGECNKYNQQLLISKSLVNKLDLENDYITNEIGSIILKGKQKEVSIFSINKN